jgi:DNA-binding NarL/FixJ family response regulator
MAGRDRTRDPSGGERPIRVLLGEDNLLAREGLASILERLEGIELEGWCRDLDALRAAIDRTSPDVVLTDVRMPPTYLDEGIRLAIELRSTHPRTGVIVLSERADPAHATALFAHGSYRRAYILIERVLDARELARAVGEVAAGGAVVDPRIVDVLLAAQRRRGRSPLCRLTAREREILGLIAEGHANAAIADRTEITKRGVERHINSIFAKLDFDECGDVSRRVKATLLYLADERRLGDGRA